MLSHKGNKNIYVFGCIENDLLCSVHSVMSYGIIFWGNSHFSDCTFKVQKRIIRVISGSERRDSCRDLYRKFQILPLPYLYRCNRRNGPDFGRVFLRSNYTDITQNTYIQSSMVTEILAREF